MSAHERRAKNRQADDEDAAHLKLGPDFDKAACLSISEAKMVLQKIENDHNFTGNPVRSQEKTAVYKKTLEHINHFAIFNTNEANEAMRDVLQRDSQLTDFERIQLANLAPHESEEAKSLIPSLSKMDDEELQTMLGELAALRRFQS